MNLRKAGKQEADMQPCPRTNGCDSSIRSKLDFLVSRVP